MSAPTHRRRRALARRALASRAVLALAGVSLASPLAAQTGRLDGTIVDSVHAMPLSGAAVSATRLGGQPETTLVATADEQGRFHFESLTPGQYAVSFASPFLDSIEFGGLASRVAVGAGQAASLALAIPSGATLRSLVCPGMPMARGSGALFGTVSDAESEQPLAGAQVVAMWTELTYDRVMRRVSTSEHSGAVLADSLGQYRLCGVPADSWLLVQVQHRARVGAAFQVIVPEETGVLLRHLSLSDEGTRRVADLDAAQRDASALPPLRGDATLVGTVTSPRGRPVVDAQVRVVSAAPVARTDAQGHFTLSGLPSGTQELEVRELGSSIQRQPVELRRGRTLVQPIQLRNVVALDTVRTVSARSRYERFEINRRSSITGIFLREDEIEKRHPLQVSDLLNAMVSFRVIGQGQYAKVVNVRDRCSPNVVVEYKQYQEINSVPVALVAALEVYPTTNGAPAEFTNLCGVIRIWIKQ